MTRLLLLLLVFGFSLFANNHCPQAKAQILDVFPVEYGKTHELSSQRLGDEGCPRAYLMPALKFESFGRVQVRFQLSPTPGGIAILEGPIADPMVDLPGQAPIVSQWPIAGDGKKLIPVSLPGVYRLYITSTDNHWESLRTDVRAYCKGDCHRRALTLVQLLSQSKALGLLTPLLTSLEREISNRVVESDTRENLMTFLREIPQFSERRLKSLNRFPVLPPMSHVRSLHPWLEGRRSEEANPTDPAFQHEEVALEQLLQNPTAQAESPPIHPRLPHVRYGHFDKRTLTESQIRHSESLARTFNALITGDILRVRIGSHIATNPKEVLQALIEAGHGVEVRSERTYANFLSLKIGESEGQVPVWFDTGLSLPGTNESVVIPMGHSHFAWHIWGPQVNARIAFYLGVGGSGFFSLIDDRPAWTGLFSLYGSKASGGADTLLVLSSIEAATQYLKRNRREAAGRPSDGYGLLGVCNDSTAFIEQLVRGKVTVFPLVRSKALPPQNDGLDPLFAKLPTDSDLTPEEAQSDAYQKDALCRVLFMAPHSLHSRYLPDAKLASQMRTLWKTLGNECFARLTE